MAVRLPTLAPLNDSTRFDIPVPKSYGSDLSSPVQQRPVVEISDPLLKDLSPEAVLDALRANNASIPTTGSKEKILADSIAEASQVERALGVRAALMGKRLKEWVAELKSWSWTHNGFEPPSGSLENEYWGALQRTDVLERDSRLERIRDELDTLEVDDLKSYIRNVHVQPHSRRMSVSSQISLSSIPYTHLADFNVLITAMIIQALPDLDMLFRLMSSWSIRITVLKQVPGFLRQLTDTQTALESAWATIGQVVDSKGTLSVTRDTYQQIKSVLETRVADLAKRIDTILDVIEGNDDSIPDRWIDDMEEAESDYKNWVVEAERLVRLHEWETLKSSLPRMQDNVVTAGPGGPAEAQTQRKEDTGYRDNGRINTASDERLEKRASHHNLHQTLNTLAPNTVINTPDTKKKHNTSLQDSESPITKGLFFMRTPTKQQDTTLDSSPTQSEPAQSGFPDIPVRHPARRPAPLKLDPVNTDIVDEAPKSHISILTSASSSGFTDMSSPQIFDASEIQYFKSPMEDQFPVTVTRDAEDIPSLRSTGYSAMNRFKHGRSISAIEPMTRSRASSIHSQLTVNGNETEEPAKISIDEKLRKSFSIEDHIQEAEEEFFDAPSSPIIIDTSPSIRVKKSRQPHDLVDEPEEGFTLSEARNGYGPKVVEDKMTAKISRLLTKIPAPIKLAAHPPDNENEHAGDSKLSNPMRQQRSVTPALTLSPVASKAKGLGQSDGGVRVYHLHQPGKDAPIKLFIRLVGSEERVMVRVGGGWADLAEYLKEYALHHGRRSVSSNNFELKGLPTAQNAAHSIFDANKSPTASATGTPNSKHGFPTSNPHTPEAKRQADVLSSAESTRFGSATSTSRAEEESSSVSLAGPKVKNIELSPQKKAWVDGMLSQARHMSSEHKKIDDVGDLGKVGNTKRIFFKGRSEGDGS